MATYTVKAPDGKTITLQGPDGASQEDIISQAQALYKPKVAPAAPKPSAAPNQYLTSYNNIRNALAAKFDDPAKKQQALTQFDSNPRVQLLRQKAGLTPLSTAKQEVRQTARQKLEQAGTELGQGSTGFQSASAGIARGMFGIPEVLAAAGERFLPSSITGNNTNASFSNILQMIRAKDTAAINAHPTAGVAGELGGSVVGAGGAGKLVMGGARRLAATGAPVVARVAQAVEGAGTLRKGAKIANAGKLVAIGAAGGTTQAAGTGEDPLTGAAEGAVAAPLFAGAAAATGKFLLRPAADVLGLSSAGSYLRRFTTATTDEMKQRLADFRSKTGAEPTLFELLPLADRNKLIQNTVAGRDGTVEQVSNAIRDRAANVQPEMADVVNGATGPQRLKTQRQLVKSLATANGGVSAPGDAQMALKASQSPTDMLNLRREESSRIMAPHDQSQVAEKFTDLIPQHPTTASDGTIIMQESDPEASRAIRSVAGNIPSRPAGTGISVQDVTNMISDLREDASQGGIEGRAADRAAHHLMDLLQQNVPEAGAAAQQMRNAYAAHSRMAEGLGEGWQQRLRDEIQVGTSNTRARGVQNAYDTDEGVAGRQLGQTNRLLSDLSGTPQSAVKSTIDLARNGNPAIAENLGTTAADRIQGAADAQAQSLEALSSAQKSASSGDGTALTPEDITTGLLALGPHPFAKARIVRKLMSASILPAGKAKVVADMLFSQDPRLTARAVNALGSQPGGATFLKYLAGTAGQLAVDANAPNPAEQQPADESDVLTAPVIAQPPAEDDIVPEEPAPDASEAPAEPSADAESPYAPALQQVYQNENPDLIDLVQRVKAQESHGDQSQVSKKGAVGVMQVMRDTGPEAARDAGVPWDPQAYHTDAAYNELLGIGYLSQLLRKYHGDVARALAAYNAGPGATDDALAAHGENFLAALPSETQDYVARVGQ